jgi:hypothetical protein
MAMAAGFFNWVTGDKETDPAVGPAASAALPANIDPAAAKPTVFKKSRRFIFFFH